MFHLILILCQYPAAIFGIWGGWLVSGKTHSGRFWGFLLWILSDILLVFYGYSNDAYGVIFLQTYYIITCIRGMKNNKE